MQPEDEKNSFHLLSGWRFSALLIILCLTIVGYLIFTLWAGWEAVASAFSEVGFMGILIPISLAFMAYLFRFTRWQHFLHLLGHYVPFKQSFRIYIGGFAFSVTPGKAGEALRSVFLRDYHVPYKESFGAFLAERFSDVMACVLLSLGGLLCCAQMRPFLYLVIGFVVTILILIQNSALLKCLEALLQKITPERFSSYAQFALETILSFKKCFSLTHLTFGILLGMLAWGLEATAFYYLLNGLEASISLHIAVFIYTFSLLIGAMTFLPAGLGGAELAMLQFLAIYQVPSSISVTATIVIRLTTLWFSVLLGILFLPRGQLKIKS
ncbi:MAG: lysylphosphatidylglycerol synthase transmembrane domain-containing protein [Parachlamydiaceae bacterium]